MSQGADLDALVLHYIAEYISLDPKPISVNPLVVSGSNLTPTQLTKDKVSTRPAWLAQPASPAPPPPFAAHRKRQLVTAS